MSEAEVKKTPATGYLALLSRNRNYRSLWSGEVVSLFGDWFNLIASASLVAHLTSSGLAVGSLFVVRMLAPFLVSPLAGVFADRYNRKWVLITCDLSRFVIVLGFLFVRHPGQAWLLYALTAVQLAVSGFFFPARSAILPDIVARNEIGTANALSSATWSVMLAVGSALGGVVAGEWGIYPAFVVDSTSFLISALFISRIHYQEKADRPYSGNGFRAALVQYLDGLAYLKEHSSTLVLTLHKAVLALVANGGFQVIQVALAERVFVIGEGGGTSLGLLYAFSGIGTGLGPILARRYTGDRVKLLNNLLALSYLITAVGLVIMAKTGNFLVVLLGTLIRAVGGGINWVFSTQLLLISVPDRVRGRVFSTEFALLTLTNAIGAAAGGWLLDKPRMGISNLLLWMAGASLLPGLLWLGWLTASNRRMLAPEDSEEHSGEPERF